MARRRYEGSRGLEQAWKDAEREFNDEQRRMRAEAAAAAEAFGAVVRERIHVDTGNLQNTADAHITNTPDRFVAEIEYGGPQAPYVVYEMARTGHDAWGSGLDEAYERVMSAIFGGPASEESGSVHRNGREAID